MTHKTNIVYFQFKLLSTNIRFGCQDSGEGAIREPARRRRSKLNNEYVQETVAQKTLVQMTELRSIFHICVYKRGCVIHLHLPVMMVNNQNGNKEAFLATGEEKRGKAFQQRK